MDAFFWGPRWPGQFFVYRITFALAVFAGLLIVDRRVLRGLRPRPNGWECFFRWARLGWVGGMAGMLAIGAWWHARQGHLQMGDLAGAALFVIVMPLVMTTCWFGGLLAGSLTVCFDHLFDHLAAAITPRSDIEQCRIGPKDEKAFRPVRARRQEGGRAGNAQTYSRLLGRPEGMACSSPRGAVPLVHGRARERRTHQGLAG
ncbi:MAG TPA: hypothetical protein VGQ83_39965 [Polyangia bacterium]